MGLNDTPGSERKHIAFFGCRNAGKSSLLNAVTGQKFAIVSDVPGTTTDPVYKSMELLPAGPVIVIDTPGLDDVGELGELRIEKAKGVLRKTDLAILVVDSAKGFAPADESILALIEERKIPVIKVYNKSDISKNSTAWDELADGEKAGASAETKTENVGSSPASDTANSVSLSVSALTGEGIFELKETIARLLNETSNDKVLVGDLIAQGDLVVLVVPIDKAAPKGRLILPQQQTIRDLLDHGAIPLVCRDSELADVIARYGSDAKLVITDSQAFKKVSEKRSIITLIVIFHQVIYISQEF